MRFASLGSGSEGNALVVEAGRSRVLLDCGFSAAETVRRLARLELQPQTLDAILVTHEHDDHVGGVARFSRKFGTPVYLSYGTHAATVIPRLRWVTSRFSPTRCRMMRANRLNLCSVMALCALVC
jgi:phosphoribosyl 1,2-cyclic phosphodiesterase